MKGPVIEINQPTSGLKWNGAIAYLDRDGVLNYGSPNYVNSPEELKLLPGAAEAVSKLRQLGYKIVITTNQSAIMRGLWEDGTIQKIHEKLQDEVGEIDVLVTCPHRDRDKCGCRKPMPGMLNSASEIIRQKSHSSINWWGEKPQPIHPLDLMVGDRDSDMSAGWTVGARLFKVNEHVGIAEVIDRIVSGDPGDKFRPV